MSELFLPKQMKKHLDNMEYERNNIGCSQAGVYRFFSPDKSFYLKIEHKSGELENEYRNIDWLQNKTNVPQIIEWVSENDFDYLLLSEIKGKMLCDDYYLNNPFIAVSILAKGIKSLQAIPINRCSINNNLDVKLSKAAVNIDLNQVDMNDWESSTSKGIYSSPKKLLDFLRENKPNKEDLVFTHGDYCLPNILGEKDSLKGFIDLGRAGVADLWQDVALCIRSLWHNFNTKKYDSLLLEKIGITLNEEKLNYYILLDELF